MTQPPPPRPPTPPPRAHRARALGSVMGALRGATWRRRLRWFAAEFLVVVSGVLVALALNAWWAGHEERAREEAYLRQLLVDTRENERRIADAIAMDSVSTDATSRAMAALHGAAPLPAADTLVRWLGGAASAADFRPLTGTYDALLRTGDLRLIRSDSLRSQLAAYATSLEAETTRRLQLRAAFLDAIHPFARAFPFVRGMFVGAAPEGVDPRALRADPEATSVLFTIQATHVNRLSGLRNLREETRALRRALEAQPALRDGA